MFPEVYPATIPTMNYACVTTGGVTILLRAWYLWKRSRGYEGPMFASDAPDETIKGVVGLDAKEEEVLRRHSITRVH